MGCRLLLCCAHALLLRARFYALLLRCECRLLPLLVHLLASFRSKGPLLHENEEVEKFLIAVVARFKAFKLKRVPSNSFVGKRPQRAIHVGKICL